MGLGMWNGAILMLGSVMARCEWGESILSWVILDEEMIYVAGCMFILPTIFITMI